MEAGLRRYWFEFAAPVAPEGDREAPPDVWAANVAVREGVGVTGENVRQCMHILRSRIFRGRRPPPVQRVIEDVDISTLGEHVLDQIEPPIWPGIWYPPGFAEAPTA